LWSPPDGADVQREQLDHLIETIDLAGVELGVIPLRSPMPVAPLSGFRLLDSELVFVETLTGEQVLTGAEAITPVIEAFEVLRAAATTGGDAVALIRRVADELASADG